VTLPVLPAAGPAEGQVACHLAEARLQRALG
jgi:hypothetical protein